MGLFLGPVLFILFSILPAPADMEPQAWRVAAIAVLMAVWWITEAIPIPATALLPILLFPVMGVMSGSDVTQSYAHHLIYLFLGGFLIAVTVEKWDLHRRIALHTIKLIGVTPDRIILGFMLATAFLSMWITNTAATMMMLTIGLAVLNQIAGEIEQQQALRVDTRKGHFRFGTALMLGIGYSASIGGVATLIGTPPNAILAGVIEQTYGTTINFLDWMLFGVPLSLLMLIITWLYLTRIAYPSEIDHLPGGRDTINREIIRLGTISRQEKHVLLVFIGVACLWIIRGLFDLEAFKMIKDSTIAIGGAMLLFIIPSDFKKNEFLLDWKTATTIPWDILILFGGGFALAQGFSESGLTHFIADQLSVLEGSNIILVVATVALLVTFLTEITSNTATASLLLPVMAALAGAMQIHPYGLMISAAIAASFAFMLPVATPPNAIVFSSRYISIPQMVRAGIWLNLIGILIITAFVIFFLPVIWGLDISVLPVEFVTD
ncbi:MAG: DASS family sodium-coupled anion symporter [Gammaproteobacteria bacterium]